MSAEEEKEAVGLESDWLVWNQGTWGNFKWGGEQPASQSKNNKMKVKGGTQD